MQEIRRNTFLTLICVFTIIGSLLTMQASNMLANDMINIANGFTRSTLLVSLPAVFMAALFPFAILWIIKVYRHPNDVKKISRVYLIIGLCLAGLGAITALLSGLVVYKSFVKPYPFPGYVIIFMMLHLFLCFGFTYFLIKTKSLPESSNEYKLTFKSALCNIAYFLLVSLVFNRFGFFLGFPVYAHWRTFYMTFPFYLYLLVPLVIFIYKILGIFGLLNNTKKNLVRSIVLLSVNVVITGAIVIIGMLNTTFISSISPAMPLERIASMPVELIIHILVCTGLLVLFLVESIKKYKASK